MKKIFFLAILFFAPIYDLSGQLIQLKKKVHKVFLDYLEQNYHLPQESVQMRPLVETYF